MSNRAKIFSPFAALRGYEDEITSEGRDHLKGNRIELSEEGKQALSQKISQLRKRQYGLLSRHLSAPQSYFPCFLLHKTSVESSYTDPSLFRTVITVLNKIFISNPKFQLLIYSVSSRTTSSKSVISLRPLTCHIPVIPGLMAILAL